MRARAIRHGFTVASLLAGALFPFEARAATSLADTVRTLYVRGRPQQAETILLKSLSARFEPSRADSLKRADLLDLLAEAQWRLRHAPPAADSIAQLAVDVRRALHGPTSDELAKSLATQARVWRGTLSVDSCIAGLERALAMHERFVPRPDTVSADMLVSLGNALRQLLRGEEAVTAQEKALAIRREALGEAHRDVARALLNLALGYEAAGRMQQRIEAEREALEIFERTRPLDTLGVLYTCKNHVGSLYEVERGAEAGPYLARWLELRPYVFADGSDEDEAAEESAGLYQVIAGDLPAARKRFARCAAIFGDGLWKRTDDAIALYWLHLSQLQQQEGNLDSALTSASRAEAIFRARYKTAPAPFLGRQWGATLDRVGQMYAFQDSLAAAETAFSVSAALHAQHRSPAHPDFARLEAEIAGVRLRMGEWDSAAAPALLAAEALTTHVRHEFARMTEDEALRYRGHGAAAALNVLLSIVCAKPDSSIVRETWKQVVRDAGLVAAETALRRRLLSSTRDSLLASWTRELVTLQARLGELELRGGHSAIADSLAARANVLEQRLAERSGRFASDFASLDASAKAIASTLPADARLVHVVRFLRSGPGVPGLAAGSRSVPPSDLRVGGPALLWYGAFVVAPGAITPAFISLGPAREIEPAADRWQRALAAGTPPTAGAIRAAKALRRRVWDPIAALVPGARLVLWVPDGTLATLPMATLPAQDGTPLLEQGPTLHILGSPRELLAHRLTPEGTRALLVGGADYGARVAAAAGVTGALPAFRGRSRDCEELAPPRYASLPGSRAEVEDVARAWSSRHDRTSDVLTGAFASEAEVRARIAGCGLVHLATHGYLVPDSCARNRLSERLLVADLRDIPQPPGAGGAMLRSGLVFAGANVNGADPGNDGLLTAADIAMLDLSSARLVTLSACESGSGRVVASEGVIGLRWALEQAGAGVTLTACHRVSDETTSRWMDDFYAAWLRDGLSAPEAARRASRQLRKELRARTGVDDPGAWGAFVTAGDWR